MIDSPTTGPNPSHNGHHPSGTAGGAIGCGAFPHQKMIIHKWGSVTYSSLKSASPTSSPPLISVPSKRSASPLTTTARLSLTKDSAPNRHAFVTTSRFDPFSFDEEVSATPSNTVSSPLKGKRGNALNGHKVAKAAAASKSKLLTNSTRIGFKKTNNRLGTADRGSDSDTPLSNLCRRGINTTKTVTKGGKAPRVSILPDPYYPYPSSDEDIEEVHKQPLTTKRGRVSRPVKMFKPSTTTSLSAASPSTFRKRGGKVTRKFRASLQPRRASTKPPTVPSSLPNKKGRGNVVDMNYALARMRSSLPLLIPLPQSPPTTPARRPHRHDETAPHKGVDDVPTAISSPPRCSIVLPRIDHVLTSPLTSSSTPGPATSEPDRDQMIAEDVTDLRGIFFGNTYIDLAAASHHRPSSPRLDLSASPHAGAPLSTPPVTTPPFTVRSLTGDRVLDSTAALRPTPCDSVNAPTNGTPSAILGDLTSTPFVTAAPPSRGPKTLKTSPGAKKGRGAPVSTRRSSRYSLRSSSSSSIGGGGGDVGGPDAPPDSACILAAPAQTSTLSTVDDALPSPPSPPSAPHVVPSEVEPPALPAVKGRKYFLSKGQAKTKPISTKNIFDWTPNLADKEEDSMRLAFEVKSPPRPEWPKSGTDPDDVHNHKGLDGPVRVRGVRQAYQCHEYGEVQDINDDVEYLLAGLKPNTSVPTKCLSILGMANKCMSAPFLTYVRSRGLINMIYQALWKTPLDPDTTLCAATFFYVLTFDKRMLADADLQTIDSLLRLYQGLDKMAPDSSVTSNFLPKNCTKIRGLFASLLRENPAEPNNQLAYLKEQLDVESRDVVSLAPWGQRVLIETLNKFCLAKDPQVEPEFTNHMRESGAENILIDTVLNLQQRIKDDTEIGGAKMDSANLKECYQRLIPLLNVVGICTSLNAKNQLHLDTYDGGKMLDATIWLLSHGITKYLSTRGDISPNPEPPDSTLPTGDKGVYVDLITACLKVVIDMTYQNESGCLSIGNRARGNSLFVDLVNLASCLKVQETTQGMYDLMVLTMGCLINLTEKCESNCHIYMEQWHAEALTNQHHYSAKRLVKTLFLYLEAAAIEYESESLPLDQDGGDVNNVSSRDSLPDPRVELSDQQAGTEKSVTKSKNDTPSASNKNADEVMEKVKVQARPKSDANSLSMYLQKAGRHMEYSTIASYISLFLGCLIHKNKDYTLRLKKLLPPDDQPFQPLIAILEKYLKFLKYTSIIGMVSTNYLSIKRILDGYQEQQYWE